MSIQSLIDKQDNFEIIRDQIAAILVAETASQQALATAAGEDPNEWKLRVYTERSNAFESWMNSQSDTSPIINVWYDTATAQENASNTFTRQMMSGTFNVDCYALGVSSDNQAGGHNPGDQLAHTNSHKAARLVRNILMSTEYRYLGLQGVVWKRWPRSITTRQMQLGDQSMLQVVATQLSLEVQYNEFAPGYEPTTLDLLTIDVGRASDGQIILEADYDYTA